MTAHRPPRLCLAALATAAAVLTAGCGAAAGTRTDAASSAEEATPAAGRSTPSAGGSSGAPAEPVAAHAGTTAAPTPAAPALPAVPAAGGTPEPVPAPGPVRAPEAAPAPAPAPAPQPQPQPRPDPEYQGPGWVTDEHDQRVQLPDYTADGISNWVTLTGKSCTGAPGDWTLSFGLLFADGHRQGFGSLRSSQPWVMNLSISPGYGGRTEFNAANPDFEMCPGL